jgi:hypothetical protein
MKISDIIGGSKKRKPRHSRKHRIIQRDLFAITGKDLTESNEARIQHLEDLVLWNGSAGAAKALAVLHQVESNPQSVTIKWDGSPAIIFGRNENGEFVLTDKSGFGAKGYDGRVTTAADLENMLKARGEAGDTKRAQFAASMKNIWDKVESTVPADFRGYVHGDLLYFSKPEVQDGRYVFQPNTTTYSVDVNSAVGKQISNSEVGVVVHKKIDLDGNISDVDVNDFQPGQTLIMPPATMSKSPGVDLPAVEELDVYLKKNAAAIDRLLTVPAELKMKDFSNILYTYINSAVKRGTLDKLGDDFVDWVGDSNISDVKKQRVLQWVSDNSAGFSALFGFIKAAKQIKNKVIELLDQQPADIQATTGGKPGGEGYVVDKDVKLVNRSGFTAANLARER